MYVYFECVCTVPDGIVLKLLSKRLSQLDCVSRGWVLHGYPNTRSQAESLAAAGFTANRSLLDCAQRTQTAAKASNLNQVIWDSNLDFWINPDLDPDRCQNVVGISHFAKCHKIQLVTVCEVLINLLKSYNGDGSVKVIQNPYPGLDHHQNLISSSDW